MFAMVFLLLSVTLIYGSEVNPQFALHRYVSNIRLLGLSNAGAALPDGIGSVMLNPSLVHTWHFMNTTSYSAGGAYARDSLFSRHNAFGGGSWYINEKTSLGVLYRYLRGTSGHAEDDIVVCFAGRLFEKSMNQGAVNIGLNVRYEKLDWNYSSIKPLGVIARVYNDLHSHVPEKDTVLRVHPAPFPFVSTKEKRLLFDLGFFQDHIAPGLDFGLVFHNLVGFYWREETPTMRWQRDTLLFDTLGVKLDTGFVVIDSAYYIDEPTMTDGKNHKSYKRLTVGVVYTPPPLRDKFIIHIPFDLEFIGLFDKKQDITIGLHTGTEWWMTDMIGLRLGYSYAPQYIYGQPGSLSVDNIHIFSGGAGIHFPKLNLDFYFRKEEWGAGCEVFF